MTNVDSSSTLKLLFEVKRNHDLVKVFIFVLQKIKRKRLAKLIGQFFKWATSVKAILAWCRL